MLIMVATGDITDENIACLYL